MEYTRCSLCGQDDTELVFVAPDNMYRTDTKSNIVRCKQCGFVYSNPRPSGDEISQHYPPERYSPYQEVVKKRTICGYLRTSARQSVAGYDKNLRWFEWLFSKTIGRLVVGMMNIVIPFKDKGRILDVGCGNGEMISWMREFGWQTYGLDVSERACEVARRQGLETFRGELQEACYADAYFDVITMSHVAEHLYDPLTVIKECHRILKDDGLLIVVCPNFDCYDCRLFKENWHPIDAPRHVNQFTKATLERLLNAAEFDVHRWKFKPPVSRDYFSKRNHKGISWGRILTLEMRATFLKALGYLFSRNRGERYAWNLAVYAVKRRS